ncbi:basic proline-rich protein-like [Caloenas nicobarica]|uniref:basic proline-rich protein-like n=1 Tax=Caloenas nicobarica TaxID=187106 RepID=UPI0032B778DA
MLVARQDGPTTGVVASGDIPDRDKPGPLGGRAAAAGTATSPAQGCAAPSTERTPPPAVSALRQRRPGAGRGGRGGARDARWAGPQAGRGRWRRSTAQLRGSGGSARRDLRAPAPPFRPPAPTTPAGSRAGRPPGAPGRGSPAPPPPGRSIPCGRRPHGHPARPPPPLSPAASEAPPPLPPLPEEIRCGDPPPRSSFPRPGPRPPPRGRWEEGRGVGLWRAGGARGEPKMAGGGGGGGRRGGLC